MTPFQLCSNVSTPTVGAAVSLGSKTEDTYKRTYQASLVGGGSATVLIQASNDNRTWATLATIVLSSTATSEGFSSEVPWLYVRANVTAVSTGKVDAVMCI